MIDETWWELCEHCWGKGMDPDDPGGCARCYRCDGAGEVECSGIDWDDEEDDR